jgi:mono/diheme cytochrome c family protein
MRPTKSAQRSLCLSAACLLLAACAPQQVDPFAHTQERDAARRGLVYAEQACASCHGVQRGEASSPMLEAPPFENVANTPGMTGLALNVWLHSEHEDMPHLMVDPDHVDDLWAYLASLRRTEPQPPSNR